MYLHKYSHLHLYLKILLVFVLGIRICICICIIICKLYLYLYLMLVFACVFVFEIVFVIICEPGWVPRSGTCWVGHVGTEKEEQIKKKVGHLGTEKENEEKKVGHIETKKGKKWRRKKLHTWGLKRSKHKVDFSIFDDTEITRTIWQTFLKDKTTHMNLLKNHENCVIFMIIINSVTQMAP